MSIITRMRKHRAVWFKSSGISQNGQETFDGPVEIRCRWDDVAETYTLPDGNEAVSKSIVYVDRVMSVNDILVRGPLTEDIDKSDPLNNKMVSRIRQFSQIDNLRATKTLYTAML